MKKKIVICVFLLLILITAIAFIIMAADTYNYEVENDDAFVGLGAFILTIIGGYVVLYELDLFYTVYYFVVKPKTITKTVLNILANISLFFMISYNNLSNFFMTLRKYEIIPYILLLIYIILRLVCFVVSARSSKQEK